ncbi:MULTISPECIES: aminodeoxychorismate lyase [Bacillaceae]|uniref:aminodeoxychorismate lyase n=1 Tax=Bacillaceae TaxID=186817 RepID=UPI001E61B16D|nr:MULTISPECIES: aminodeoxychorismate lyase [Bacillaceae]MCE4051793.1 aminodeoxychorismate lyase [Bacillus sp. Au-Bac7]MDL0437334.1 aminodeoxychorismate lyase [Niallia sp. SS-2023]UPO87750.1 aminodeoxychorismate lyase [Niallia sp. Man26]
MYIYINGEIIPHEKAQISVFDHGFMYGAGLFETFRTYRGHPFLLDSHLGRLNKGLRQLNIDRSFYREETNQIIQRLLNENKLENAYIRFNVSAGIGGIGLQTSSYTEPNVIMYMKSLQTGESLGEKKAEWLRIRRNTPEGDERLKSHHYLNNLLAKREIGEDVQMEGLFLTKEGYVAEGITSNLFWIRNGILYTPSVETGILNGITRRFILALAAQSGLEVREGLYKQENLLEADEVFITNSIQEIVAIKSIGSESYKGVSGPIVQMLYTRYKDNCSYLWSIDELGGHR